MAAYVSTRQRLLRGMGETYAFVPRRRTLRGMGDSTDIDMVTGLPCDDPRANCGPAPPDIGLPSIADISPIGVPGQPARPPFVFTDVRPILPTVKTTPVAAPNIGPGLPPGSSLQIVFPSQGTVKYAAAAPPATSWLDQQMIAGLPNSYLALGTVGLVLFLSMSGAKRRR